MNDFFYKKLEAYKLAKEFTIYVYSLLKKFPSYEQYAMCDQLRRAETLTKVMSGLRKTLSEKMNYKGGMD